MTLFCASMTVWMQGVKFGFRVSQARCSVSEAAIFGCNVMWKAKILYFAPIESIGNLLPWSCCLKKSMNTLKLKAGYSFIPKTIRKQTTICSWPTESQSTRCETAGHGMPGWLYYLPRRGKHRAFSGSGGQRICRGLRALPSSAGQKQADLGGASWPFHHQRCNKNPFKKAMNTNQKENCIVKKYTMSEIVRWPGGLRKKSLPGLPKGLLQYFLEEHNLEQRKQKETIREGVL